MVSLIDLLPTAYDVARISIPPHVQGKSLLPLVEGKATAHHDAIFAEVNYHAAYEPMRCIRTDRYKYIRRYDARAGLVLPNVDDTPSKEFLLKERWQEQPRAQEMLYDLIFDPAESNNLIHSPAHAELLHELQAKLDRWMAETSDPILQGVPLPAPHGSAVNDVDGLSPNEPTIVKS
jgi:arylsulfatase A-like enzyme